MSLWLRFYPGADRLLEEAAAFVRTRVDVLRALEDREIEALPPDSYDQLQLDGKTIAGLTWHHNRGRGTHWVVVQAWGTGVVLGGFLLAQAGFESKSGARRKLTERDLFEGGFD